jgi:hypothetical protein
MSRPSPNGIVIVGAGPYGLSVAAHLRRHGLPFRIFGSPMQSWRSSMPAGMFLKSEGRASSLSDPAGSYTLKAHCEQYGLSYGEYGVPVPLETFFDYGRKFQQRFVPDVEDSRVLALHRSSHGYELQTATSELVTAKSVVVAAYSAAAGPSARELVSHTSHHRSFGAFSGRDLTVIGGGQSALETAALAREQGANVRVLVRQPKVVWNGVPHQEPRPPAQRLRRPTTGFGDGWAAAVLRQFAGHVPPAAGADAGPRGEDGARPRRRLVVEGTGSGAAASVDRPHRRQRRGSRQPSAPAGEAQRRTGDRPDHRAPDRRDRLPDGPGPTALPGRSATRAPTPGGRGARAVVQLRGVSSGPVLRRVGVRAQLRTVMRFLHGADYSARRLVGHLLPRAAGAPSLGRARDDPWCRLVNMPGGVEGW